MSRFLAALAVLTLVVAAAPHAQASVDGEWTLTVNGPQGSLDVAAKLKQDGEKVTGTFSGPQGDVDVNGTMKGSTLAIQFHVESPQGALDIKLTAEVTGADMKGNIDFGMGQADFTGKKK